MEAKPQPENVYKVRDNFFANVTSTACVWT
jgi:hypothetical protein